MLEGVANNVNKDTDRKNVLTAANVDYLKLSTPKPVSIGDDIIITFDTQSITASSYAFSSLDGLTLRVIFQARKVGTIIGCTHVSTTANGVTIPNNSDLSFYYGQVIVLTFESTVNSDFSTMGIRASNLTFPTTWNINNFIIGTETFSLNEGNGATFTGSNGTTGTRQTSHSDDLNYINFQVIKPI